MAERSDTESLRRNSIRLKGHDYATPGIYFVTICVENKLSLLGGIDGGLLAPAIAGLVVESWWCNLTRRFPSIQLGS